MNVEIPEEIGQEMARIVWFKRNLNALALRTKVDVNILAGELDNMRLKFMAKFEELGETAPT